MWGVQTPSKAHPDGCTGTGCFVSDFARTLHGHFVEACDQLLSLIWTLSEYMKILNWKPIILLKCKHYNKCFCFIQNVANKNTNNRVTVENNHIPSRIRTPSNIWSTVQLVVEWGYDSQSLADPALWIWGSQKKEKNLGENFGGLGGLGPPLAPM